MIGRRNTDRQTDRQINMIVRNTDRQPDMVGRRNTERQTGMIGRMSTDRQTIPQSALSARHLTSKVKNNISTLVGQTHI